jgi:tetraacyldisaccharide 4'-kinase
MRAPRFWDNPPAAPGIAARLLAPAARVWAWEAARRQAGATPARLPVPVICIGNVSAGGTGKTPAVIALMERLDARGISAHVLSRGHGGSLPGPLRVIEGVHNAAQVGDEPLLLSAFAPVWIGADRAASGRAAVAAGAQALVMDDGFQNPGLHKDHSLLVVDGAAGFGNGRVMPAGPLREPVPAAMARADMVLVIGSVADRARLLDRWPEVSALPVLDGAIMPLATGMDWQGLRVIAFAGIGRPVKFFTSLRRAGAEIVAAHGFADHEAYDTRMLARLDAEAATKSAQLVTTEKDAARLPPDFRRKVLVLPVRLQIANWSPLDAAFDRLGL